MAPQTRSTTKPSPGRSTRNSIFGRQPLPPPKPRTSSPDKSRIPTASPVYDTEVERKVTFNASDTKGTPWLACRDPYGVMTTIAVSETGEGIHIRWYYPEDDCEACEDEDTDVEMRVDDERGVTPVATAESSSAARRTFPQTPIVPHPYDAGSVIRTPVKKARPLQRSPLRIGDKGIRCLYEKEGVLRELNGGVRIVLRHPVGSTANLSREQVELLEEEREEKIIRVQVEKLLAEKKRAEEEEEGFSDSGYEDEMEVDHPLFHRDFRRDGTDDTIPISESEVSDIVSSVSAEEMDSAPGVIRGSDEDMFDHHGQHILGPEGTILIDSTYGLPRGIKREEVPTEIVDHSICASEGLGRARFGPEGTELIQ